MKYRLSRPIFPPLLEQIAIREMRRQKIRISSASRAILNKILFVSAQIEKEGLPSQFVCRKLPGKLGRGIFLHPKAKAIQRGEVIAPYGGVLRIEPQYDAEDSDYAFAPLDSMKLTKEEQKKVDPTRKYHPGRLYELDLDAQKEGNFTRFINHSEKPNVEARILRIPKNSIGLTVAPTEIVYFAKKTIHPGEQLLICYEVEKGSYWGILGIQPSPISPKTFMLDDSLRLVSTN